MLDKLLVSDILYAATSTGAEFAEVFVENNKKNSLGLINGKLERALSGIDFGIGIRIINKDRMVYVYTNKKDRESLINLAKNGATAIKGNSKQKQIVFNDLDYRKINNNNIEIYPSSIYSNKIVEIMKEGSNTAFYCSSSIFCQVNKAFSIFFICIYINHTVLIYNSYTDTKINTAQSSF